MKKCNYCGKEVSYQDFYCSDECQNNANKFYDMQEKISTIMGIFNGVCVMSIGIGLFVFSFFKEVGAYMVSVPLLILGLLFLLFPMPADVMIEKYKIQKSVKLTKLIAIILLALGAIALTFTIISI